MIATFQALAVALLAVLPGALYVFSYERLVGSFGVALADRVVRFLGASAVFVGVFSGPAYRIYKSWIVTGALYRGDVKPLWVELTAVAYLAAPIVCGSVVGHGQVKGWRWVRFLAGAAPEPRAWDFTWNGRTRAVVRLRLKSGRWIAGVFGDFGTSRSYAAGYPEEGDLLLARQLRVNPKTGEYVRKGGEPEIMDAGILVRWARSNTSRFRSTDARKAWRGQAGGPRRRVREAWRVPEP